MSDQEKTKAQLVAELEEKVKERTAELAIFQRFVEASGLGFGMADLDGRITYWNPQLCRLCGEARPEDVVGQHVAAYFPADYLQKRQTEILPAVIRDGYWQGELVVHSRQGQTTPILQNMFLIRDEAGRPVRLAAAITDITQRKAAEEALRQSHDELQAIYDGMVDGIIVVDIEKPGPVRANAAACRMLGYSEEEAKKLVPDDVHPPASMPFIWKHLQEVAEGRLARADNMPFLRRDGSVFYADVVSSRIVYNRRLCRISFLHDVTERKQAQEALERERQTLEHMLQASDHERQLIAYDIHDGLAQYLTGAIMQLEHSRNIRPERPKDGETAFAAGLELLRQSHFETRRLISGVRPPILDESGVVAAIAHLVYDVRAHAGGKVEFHGKVAFGRLAPTLENSIYRIVQEGLNNALRHSQSDKISVGLVQRGDRVRIAVRDQGIGFDPQAVDPSRFGLEGIRERARLLGGNATITSQPGKGTRVVVDLPIVPRKENNDS